MAFVEMDFGSGGSTSDLALLYTQKEVGTGGIANYTFQDDYSMVVIVSSNAYERNADPNRNNITYTGNGIKTEIDNNATYCGAGGSVVDTQIKVTTIKNVKSGDTVSFDMSYRGCYTIFTM